MVYIYYKIHWQYTRNTAHNNALDIQQLDKLLS